MIKLLSDFLMLVTFERVFIVQMGDSSAVWWASPASPASKSMFPVASHNVKSVCSGCRHGNAFSQPTPNGTKRTIAVHWPLLYARLPSTKSFRVFLSFFLAFFLSFFLSYFSMNSFSIFLFLSRKYWAKQFHYNMNLTYNKTKI